MTHLMTKKFGETYTDMFCEQNLKVIKNHYITYFKEYELSSHFQPIYTFAHPKPIGYEALLRIKNIDGESINPEDFFQSFSNNDDILTLEQLSISLHVHNFHYLSERQVLLFLNISPKIFKECPSFSKMLTSMFNQLDILSTSVVLEIIEQGTEHQEKLISSIEYLKYSGFMVAIDDFGAGHSNFNRILELKPDIVKLDKQIMSKFRNNKNLVSFFSNLVELLHESNSLVLLEGIEDEADAKLASLIDIDMHQGYFFGKPNPELLNENIINPYFSQNLKANFDELIKFKVSKTLEKLFCDSADKIKQTNRLIDSCEALLNHPSVIRCYRLNKDGEQTSEVYGFYHISFKEKNKEFLKTKKANWSRRPYFYKAKSHVNKFQKSRPYLSLTGAHRCITFSMGVLNKDNEIIILCCDIKAY